MKSQDILYHAIPTAEVLRSLTTKEAGLSSSEAAHRLSRFGLNEIRSEDVVHTWAIFFRQFRNSMVYILLAASVLSWYYSHYIDAAVILGIIILNAAVGFVQEYRAEKAILALKKLIVKKAKVYRDDQLQEIEASQIVVGDVILLEEGDVIAADARVMKSVSFQAQESVLTGESLPVDKTELPLDSETPMAERTNMVFSGTIAVRGSAVCVVVSTGIHTALGHIARDLRLMGESKTHFDRKSTHLTKQMATVALLTAVATFVVGFFLRGIPLEEILPFTLAALVSAIPESLPLVFMIVLTVSARRMAKRNAIVRHLTAAETLGVVDVIITDKTGTLTQNKMVVEKFFLGDSASAVVKHRNASKKSIIFDKLLTVTAICNSVRLQVTKGEEGVLVGDPTEKAFYSFAHSINSHVSQKWEKIADLPFNQNVKARACISQNRKTGETELFVIGAPEALLGKCSSIMTDKSTSKLTGLHMESIEMSITSLTNDAMRVIGVAYKKQDRSKSTISESDISNLVWVGAVAMIDPARPEAASAIRKARSAGIRVIMATGDHPATAHAIAKSIGLESIGPVITATDMEKMSDEEFIKVAAHSNVFARMTPQSKLRLAKTLQKMGAIIAMTGDGVNDAPVLKGADVGVSMGKGGTDVAREASDIVLADDNFATIISAIEEGRTQFRNMRRTSFFLITTNVAESISLLTFLFLGLPIPLLPKQILWLNLIGGGVTDIALATEPIHGDVLDFPPKNSRENILNASVLPLLFSLTISMTIIALGVYFVFIPQGMLVARTAVFVVLSTMQLVNLLNVRSLKKSIFKMNVFSNRQINYALLISLGLLIAVVYIPFFANIFEFHGLTAIEFSLLLAVSLSILVVGEVIKMIQRSTLRMHIN